MSRGVLRRWVAVLTVALVSLIAVGAQAQSQGAKPSPPRDAQLTWDADQTRVLASVSFRDVANAAIRRKLSRGLPTTIVLTATVHRAGSPKVLSTTAQTCRITWLVWDEYYKIEITRPGRSRVEKTVKVEGVLRRCAEARNLMIGTKDQLPTGAPLYLRSRVLVNPISDAVVKKIKRWVNRTSGTSTAGPSDALFSTFTNLFLRRIGRAERELLFTTKPVRPTVPPKKKK